MKAAKWMLTLKPDQVFVVREKEGTASALLKEAGVEVILVEEPNMDKKGNSEHYEKSCQGNTDCSWNPYR